MESKTCKCESNNTATILILSVLCEKMTMVADLMKTLNGLTADLHELIRAEKPKPMVGKVIIEPLLPEDYIE